MTLLASNRRTTVKAAIKRASARGRASMNRLDRDYLSQLDQLYRTAARDIQSAIQARADSGGFLRIEVMRSLLGQVNQRIQQLSTARNRLLDDGLPAAAALGTRPFSGAPEVSAVLPRVADEAVRFVQRFVNHDGLQLSDRLWRLDNGAREGVTRAIQSAIVQGQSASQAANDFLSRGEQIPASVLNKRNLAQSSRISTAAASELLTKDGNPRVNALRVFRTELNRAHGEAYQAAAFEHPDAVGTRYLLSPGHPRPDICDMHARVNRYGLGPGVYPKGRSPWPAHPNTLSYEEVVFSDEVSPEDKAAKEDRVSWLKQQRPGVQESVLGSRKKRAALEHGILKENEIATPWKILKKRYERRGIDTDQLIPSLAEPVTTIPGKISEAPVAKDAPVSDALDVQAHKGVASHVLNVIDSLHGDGSLPRIPLRSSPSSAGYLGAYFHTVGGKALRINVTAGGSHKALTMAHEIGHFIDHKGAPGTGFSSLNNELFARWRKAVNRSNAIKSSRKLLEGPEKITLPDGGTHIVKKSFLRYLLSHEEMWARSYAQWIATKSGDKLLASELDGVIAGDAESEITYARQWARRDFEPIGREIERIIKKMGWL